MAILLLDHGFYVGFAVSLRKLRTAYAGNCFKVRRSSDSTEQDIGFSNDVVDSSAVASFIGGGSGFFSKWYDQSLNAYDFNQTTAGQQPQWIASSNINSKPAGRYDGSDDNVQINDLTRRQSDFTHINEMTLLAVVNQTASNDGTIYASDYTILNTNNHAFYARTYATNTEFPCWFGHFNRDGFYNTIANGSATWPSGWAGNPHVFVFYAMPDGTAGVEVDGTSIKTGTFRGRISTATQGSQPNNYPAMIGKSFAYGTPFLGDIAELIVFKTGLTATRRAFVTQNAKTFYGIS